MGKTEPIQAWELKTGLGIFLPEARLCYTLLVALPEQLLLPSVSR
jgi:hypothetical protein